MAERESVGQRLRALREAKPWTQAELSTAAEVGERTIRRIEAGGRASMETLRALAGALDVGIDVLLGRTYLHTSTPEGVLAEGDGTSPARKLREVLVADMIRWPQEPMFAAAAEIGDLAKMRLGDFYVEPLVHAPRQWTKALGGIRKELQERSIVVVTAPFGHGKSLTARMLAAELATELAAEREPASECWYPILVPLGRHASYARDLDLELLIRRATREQARPLGYDEDLSDAIYTVPGREQRTLVILDGLDEVHLDPRAIEAFFRMVRDASSARRSFVIFARPEVLPSPFDLEEATLLRLEPFGAKQVSQWLAAWSSVYRCEPLCYEHLQSRGLHKLAAVPVILFLIAYCWDQYVHEADSDEAVLYERFAQRLISGKLAETRERHRRVDEVGKQLVPALVRTGMLRETAVMNQQREALLWLMGRIAWSDHVMELSGGRELTEQDILEVLTNELEIPSFDAHNYRVALLISHQHEEEARRRSVFFGHRSLREFFVARHWLGRMLELLVLPDRRDAIEAELMAAPVLLGESRCFHFLRLMLARLDEAKRASIAAWACRIVEDETLRWGSKQDHCLAYECGSSLRVACLGIYCECAPDVPSLSASVLRTMLAPMWGSGRWQLLWAPRLDCPDLDLSGTRLNRVNLEGARLRGANLARVCADEARLRGIVAPKLTLAHAELNHADLTGAAMDHCTLDYADLSNSMMQGASLREASLMGSKLRYTDLSDANLTSARAEGASFSTADLVRANLSMVDFRSVDLEDANLTEASLVGAQLVEANLMKAVFRRADLRGADLAFVRWGADGLAECVFEGTKYDADTKWPPGFDPGSVPGLVPVDARPEATTPDEAEQARTVWSDPA